MKYSESTHRSSFIYEQLLPLWLGEITELFSGERMSLCMASLARWEKPD